MSLAAISYVRDLLARMDNNGLEGNDLSIAIAAHDEARTLADPLLIPLLMLEAEAKLDQYRQKAIYFALQHLALNCEKREVHEFFLLVLKKDRRLFITEYLLKYLESSPWFEELKEGILLAALPFAGNAHYGVLGSIGSIFRHFRDRRIVDAMLQALERPKLRPYQVNSILCTLAGQQDETALPAAQRYIESKEADEVLGALYCIVSIERTAATPLLISKLNHGSESVRVSAIRFLCRLGDASALESMAELLLSRTSRRRKWSYADYQSWVNYASLYLLRNREANPALVDSCFDRLFNKSHWKNLFEDEQEFLATIQPQRQQGSALK